jgi:predicted regulator of Ras-like GTPase activity (Roadblock/LC7/MglB family)
MSFIRSKWGVLVIAATLGFGSLSSLGCGKKSEATSDESSAKKSKDEASDDDSADSEKKGKKGKKKAKADDDKGDEKPAKAGKSGKYAQGDVLEHVPKECSMLRLYVDVRALQKNEAFAANTDTLQEKLTSAMKDDGGEKGQKVMKALKKAGIDPTKDVRELAMCGQGKDDFVMAIGGDFGAKDPLDALSKALEDSGDDAPKSSETDGVKMLEIKGKKGKTYVGAVSPGVLVLANDKDVLAGLKDAKPKTSDWDVDSDRLAFFYFREKGKMAFDLTMSTQTDGVEVKFIGTFEDKTGDKMKEAPKAIEAEFVKMAGKFGTKMAGTPFDAIGSDVKATKISVAGNVVTVILGVANDHLAKLIKAVAESTPKELKSALK